MYQGPVVVFSGSKLYKIIYKIPKALFVPPVKRKDQYSIQKNYVNKHRKIKYLDKKTLTGEILRKPFSTTSMKE